VSWDFECPGSEAVYGLGDERRDRVQGVCIEAEPSKLVELAGGRGVVRLPSAGLVKTDLEQESFQYTL
jgi:ACS family allantoate permease-like MFS transporter